MKLIDDKYCSVFLIVLAIVYPFFLLAQSPKPGINFQAVAKDKNNNPAANKTVHVKTEIFSNDTLHGSFLTEEHLTTTNASGIFQVAIGKGNRVGGSYYSIYEIPWNTLNFQIRVRLALEPSPLLTSWNYQQEWVDMGFASLELVPFSLYSLSSNTVYIKSKNRSSILQQVDSFFIQLSTPLDIDDGISIALESPEPNLLIPSYFIFRDLVLHRVMIYFSAPYSGYINWMIID